MYCMKGNSERVNVFPLKWIYIRGRRLMYFRGQTSFQAMSLQRRNVHCKDSLFKPCTPYSHLWSPFSNWNCQSA